jgi:cytochrome c biogenesis protein
MTDSPPIRMAFFHSLWKFFASIRLTVVMLLSLALLSIIGTLVPQNQSPAEYFSIFGPFRYQLMATLDIFDLYHAWWFQGLILILTANIIVCSIDRLRSTGRMIFDRSPQLNLDSFRRRKDRQEFQLNGSPESLVGRFQEAVAASFGRCRLETAENGFVLTVDKGRWTRLGVYGVHLSIVVLLVGALISGQFGFEGYVNIAEGERSDTIQLQNSTHRLKLPFSIQCDDFDVQYYEGGKRPKEFRSRLSLYKAGQKVIQKDVVMNAPLRYQGINIFQSSYGELEPAATGFDPSQSLPEKFTFNFRSAASGMIYTQTAGMGETMQLPEGLGHFTVERFEPKGSFKGMDIGPCLVGTLALKGGPPQTILLPFNHPGFDGMRQGAVVISVDNALPAPQPRYYTGLQVTKDPGVGLVYFGFIMLISGCAVVFFMSHQRLVVEVKSGGQGGARVMVSGTANKNKFGFAQKMQRLAEQLAKMQ